LINKS